MGVSTTTNRIIYSGDGSTTTFAFAFYFFAQTDLKVWVYDTLLGGATLKVLSSDYTISGTPNAQGLYSSGGSVVFGAAPLSTDKVVIFRSPARVQNFALGQNAIISSSATVQELDYLTLLIQRLDDKVSRAAMLPDGMGATFSNLLPETIALAASENATLVVNAAGNGFDLGPTVTSIATDTALAVASAAAAATSASGASTSATNAASSATAAAASASAASTSATSAASSATAAASSATSAASSATAAAASAASVSIGVSGSKASPNSIVALTGITFSSASFINVQFIKGTGGVVVTANPQIAAGSSVGQSLELYGTSDTDTVQLANGTGLDLNGLWIGGANSKLCLMWDGTLWSESYRR